MKRTTFVAFVAGLVAWLVVIPLAAYHFEQFNPWTVPFGVLLSPIAITSLIAGFLKIVLTAICPPLAGNGPRCRMSRCGSPSCSALDGASPRSGFADDATGHRIILLYYALLILPLLEWPRRTVRWCARLALVGACMMGVVLPLCGGILPHHSGDRAIRVTLLSLARASARLPSRVTGRSFRSTPALQLLLILWRTWTNPSCDTNNVDRSIKSGSATAITITSTPFAK